MMSFLIGKEKVGMVRSSLEIPRVLVMDGCMQLHANSHEFQFSSLIFSRWNS